MSAAITGPRAQFHEFLRKVTADLGLDSGEVQEIVRMMKPRVTREDFLFCLHQKAPCLNLSKASFAHLVEVLRALLREAGNAGDFESISSAFRLSQLYGRRFGTYEYSLLLSLSSHDVWRDDSYWLQTTDKLLSKDIFRWQALSSISKKLALGVEIKDAQVFSLFAILRIQSIAFGSMRRLGVPVSIISSYLKAAMRNYGLDAANIDITQRPTEGFILGMLDFGVDQTIKPTKREKEILHSLSTQESVTNGLNSDIFGDGDVIIAKYHPRCRNITVGYSALLEVIFYLAMLHDPNSPTAKLMDKIKKERKDEKDFQNHRKMKKYDLKCVCGLDLYNWKPCSGVFESTISNREYMSYFLCEMCFRQCMCPLKDLNSIVNGGVNKAIVPFTRAEQSQSFLSIFYGNSAARRGFLGTTGYNVRLHALGEFTTSSTTFKKRGKVKKKRMSSMPSPLRSHSSGFSADFVSDGGDETDSFGFVSSSSDGELFDDDIDSKHSDFFSESLSDEFSEDVSSKKSITKRHSQKRDALQDFVVMMQAGVDVLKMKSGPFARTLPRTLFLDSRAQCLCWLPPGRAELVSDTKSSIPVDSIQSIKEGSGKFNQCISIISERRTLVIKVDDASLYSKLMSGFPLLTEANKSKKNSATEEHAF